uniref:G-protein coupled receptors family 1 profile domain-containing protein n=1 Tax=Trichuris muris TaxID=70415 RepID=A0A5S6QGV8_TRIMR
MTSLEDIRCRQGPQAIWYVNVALGVTAFFSNICFLAVTLREKPMKRTQKLVAAYAVGCATSGAGFAAAFTRRILLHCKDMEYTPIECMYRTPHLSLYAVGEAFTTFCVLFMSVDRLVAILYSNRMNQWKKYLTNRLLFIAVALTVTDVLWAWISAWNKGEELIPAYCYRVKVVSNTYYLTHFICCGVFGYITLILYCIALAVLKRMRSTSHGIRSIQLKREATISKRIMIIVFFTFLLQSIPTTLRLYALFSWHLFFVPDQLWSVHCVNLSIYAVYSIVTNLEIWHWISKLNVFSKLPKPKIPAHISVPMRMLTKVRDNQITCKAKF